MVVAKERPRPAPHKGEGPTQIDRFERKQLTAKWATLIEAHAARQVKPFRLVGRGLQEG